MFMEAEGNPQHPALNDSPAITIHGEERSPNTIGVRF